MGGKGLQPAVIALQYVPSAIAGAVVVVRIWRKRLDRALGGDDYTIIIAWILALIQGILTHIYVVATFGGYYPQDIPMDQFLANRAYAAKIQWAFAIEYTPIVCTVKLSFLWSLQKLRSGNVWIRRSLWGVQIFNASSGLVATLMNAFPCIHLSKHLDPTIPGSCLDNYKFLIGIISMVLATDVMVLIMPTWMIYDLQMPLRKKLLSIAFLSMGVIVIVVGSLRLHWLMGVFSGKFNTHSVEQAYSAIEGNIAIIAACGPTIKYILGLVFPQLKSSHVNTTKKPSGYGYGNSSAPSRRERSKYDTELGDGPDDESLGREDIEMKGDGNWKWKSKDSGAESDEQRITGENDGITKTVDWTISTKPQSIRGAPVSHPNADSRSAVQPANVV